MTVRLSANGMACFGKQIRVRIFFYPNSQSNESELIPGPAMLPTALAMVDENSV
jgi:hypothetical protein